MAAASSGAAVLTPQHVRLVCSEARLREIFQKFQEPSGDMKACHLGDALRLAGMNPINLEVAKVLDGLRINFAEFLRLMKEQFAVWSKRDQVKELQSCFERFDTEKTGFVSRETISKILRMNGNEVAEDKLEEMLKGSDARFNGQGYDYLRLIWYLMGPEEETVETKVEEDNQEVEQDELVKVKDALKQKNAELLETKQDLARAHDLIEELKLKILRYEAAEEMKEEVAERSSEVGEVKDLREVKTTEEESKVEFLQQAEEIRPELDVLHFAPKQKAAVIDGADEISYHGDIREDATSCYISFPGKYKAGWDALVAGLHGDSVACVFLCESSDGLGQHEKDPAFDDGRCYCGKIYGERSYKEFGYLHTIKKRRADCTEEEVKKIQKKAESMQGIVVFADATPEERKQKEEEAKAVWARHKTAAWGCAWYDRWLKKVEQAVELGQRLKVVFFPGEVGEGKLTMSELSTGNLWDGLGCGGSQKCEIATVEAMRQATRDARWDYEGVDVSLFLADQFQPEDSVEALDGDRWRQGVVLEVKKKERDAPTWKIQCKWSSKQFYSNHFRHSSDFEEVVKAFQEDATQELLRTTTGLKIHECKQATLKNGSLSIAVKVDIPNIKEAHMLRDNVLSGALDENCNKILSARKKITWEMAVERSHFLEYYERTLPGLWDLTAHQEEKLKELETADFHEVIHVKAPAGAGKTFVALRHILRCLQASRGQVLFVAPSRSLILHILQWLLVLGQVHRWEVSDLLERIAVMHQPYDERLIPRIHGDRMSLVRKRGGCEEFEWICFDESHQIFCSNEHSGQQEMLRKLPGKQVMLLSDLSQSSTFDLTFDQHFPKRFLVELHEVVRSTQRIVAGASSFQLKAAATSLRSIGTDGPPLKSFIFEVSVEADRSKSQLEQDIMDGYVKHTIDAIWYLVCSFPSLSLHRRLALLLPDENFAKAFKPLLQSQLENDFPHRNFDLVSCEDSLSYLPFHLLSKPSQDARKETIVLDTVWNAAGLEYLIVMSIGLDAAIDESSSSRMTRSRLYQGITRSQLVAIVVNELIQDGWLEFLGTLKLKTEKFEKELAFKETRKSAAGQMVTGLKTEEPSPTGKSSAKAVEEPSQPQGSEARTVLDFLPSRAVNPFKSIFSALTSSRVGPGQKKGEDRVTIPRPSSHGAPELEEELLVRSTYVWDTESNAINNKIFNLKFDPLAQVQIHLEAISWRQINPQGPVPGERGLHSAAYDPESNSMVVLWGSQGGRMDKSNDAWALDLKAMSWKQLHPSGTAPSARHLHSSIYDPCSNSLVAFGGWCDTRRNDVWTLDFKAMSWKELSRNFETGGRPSKRQAHSAIYHPESHSMVIFGGIHNPSDAPGNRCLGDVWAFDLKAMSWKELHPTGTAPSARCELSAIYDPPSHSMVFFGGLGDGDTIRNDVWALDLKAMCWKQLHPTGTAPSKQKFYSAIYHPETRSMVVFGGKTDTRVGFNDVWVLDLKAKSWRQLHPGGTAPTERWWASAVYDPESNSMIVFGGQTEGPFRNDVWALDLKVTSTCERPRRD